jgi:hypothetical protein
LSITPEFIAAMKRIIKLLGHPSAQICLPDDVACTIELGAEGSAILQRLGHPKANREIYALHSCGEYTLHLGCPSWMNSLVYSDENGNEDDTMEDAFHYLQDLALGINKIDSNVKVLGEICFIDNPHPGSSLRYVLADSIEALAGLQFQLNQLKKRVRIQIEEN